MDKGHDIRGIRDYKEFQRSTLVQSMFADGELERVRWDNYQRSECVDEVGCHKSDSDLTSTRDEVPLASGHRGIPFESTTGDGNPGREPFSGLLHASPRVLRPNRDVLLFQEPKGQSTLFSFYAKDNENTHSKKYYFASSSFSGQYTYRGVPRVK
ncbi:hypothetical protein J6590_069069 [Homalodisca vitripennis]|nr:hypothetical protein J6590_069069 [Homalodisca vitripennis]